MENQIQKEYPFGSKACEVRGTQRPWSLVQAGEGSATYGVWEPIYYAYRPLSSPINPPNLFEYVGRNGGFIAYAPAILEQLERFEPQKSSLDLAAPDLKLCVQRCTLKMKSIASTDADPPPSTLSLSKPHRFHQYRCC
jgi:hypothetical protein